MEKVEQNKFLVQFSKRFLWIFFEIMNYKQIFEYGFFWYWQL